MAIDFSTQTKGVWTFNSTLGEEKSGKDFALVSGGATYGSFTLFDFSQSKNVIRKGLQFVDGVSFNAGSDFDFRNTSNVYQLLIIFWWHSPGIVGQTRHAVTRQLVPKIAPILAMADSTVVNDIETLSAGEWVISEIGYSKTQNAIQFALCDGGTIPTQIFTSEPYTPGLHSIGIVMRPVTGGKDLINLVIDGKPEKWCLGPTTVPTTVSSLRLNDIGYGYTAHKTTQVGGIIGDLVIVSSVGSDIISHPLKHMRFGWESVVSTNILSNLPTFNAIAFDQPSTITTTQLFTIGDNIIAARSDGELLSGTRPIWDNILSFTDPDSVLRLNTSTLDACPPVGGSFSETDRTVCWTDDGLRVQGATVRI